jgi:predicted XRE-type DNA-binding protein
MSNKDTTRNFKMAERIKYELMVAIERTMKKDEISQGEVARRIGALRYNVNKVMRGKVPVSVDLLLKMAESIGLDVELKFRKGAAHSPSPKDKARSGS